MAKYKSAPPMQIDLLNLRTNLRSQILTQEGLVASTRTQYVNASQQATAADSLIRLKLMAPHEASNAKAQAEEYTTRLRVERDRLALMSQAIDSQIAVQGKRVVQLQAIAANQQNRLRSLQVRAQPITVWGWRPVRSATRVAQPPPAIS